MDNCWIDHHGYATDQAAMNIVFADGIAPFLISMPFSHY